MNRTPPDRHCRMRLKAISATASVLLAEALLAGWSFASADRALRKALQRDLSGGELIVVQNLSEVTSVLQRLEISATVGWLALAAGLSGLLFVRLHCTRTKLHAQQKALRESEKRYVLLAEQSRTFAWEIDAKGVYTYVSHVVRGVLGFRPDELVGKRHFYDLHPAEHRPAFKNATFEIIARKQPFLGLDNQVVSKDGRLVWVSTSGLPILDAQGNLQGYRGSDTDITEQKRKEQKLLESECRMRALTDSARADFPMAEAAKASVLSLSEHTAAEG